MLLDGQVSVVTGASRGIGKSIALQFASEGADLVVVARNKVKLEQLATQITDLGRRCLVIPIDVANNKDVDSCVAHVVNEFGTIDILVNNAGIAIERSFLKTSLEDWERTLGTNLYGAIFFMRAVLPVMLANRQGKIINIASGAGLRGLPGSSAYAASKAALIALGTSLASEIHSQGVQVNTICPGPIDTEMSRSAVEDFAANSSDLQSPDDVAGAALFLASRLAGKTTGQTISVRTTNRW